MNVSIPPELEEFVRSQIARGKYQDPGEVIRAGLLRLKEAQEKVISPQAPATREEMETELLRSVDQMDRGAGLDSEKVFKNLERRVSESNG